MNVDYEEKLYEFQDIIAFYYYHKREMTSEDEKKYADKIEQYSSFAYVDNKDPQVRRVWRSLVAFYYCMNGKYGC